MRIRNLLFQPLTLNMTGGDGIHLSARESRDIEDAVVSDEIRLAADRGLVALTEVPAQGETTPSETEAEAESADADSSATSKRGTRK